MVWIGGERRHGEVVILDLVGQRPLGGASEETLPAAVERRVQSGSRKFLLNLSQVGYIESQSLAEIVRSSTVAGQAGGRLKLVGVSSRIKELLNRTRLSPLFDAFESEQDALDSFERAEDAT
jgi:anti-sigma B factor antagonist